MQRASRFALAAVVCALWGAPARAQVSLYSDVGSGTLGITTIFWAINSGNNYNVASGTWSATWDNDLMAGSPPLNSPANGYQRNGQMTPPPNNASNCMVTWTGAGSAHVTCKLTYQPVTQGGYYQPPPVTASIPYSVGAPDEPSLWSGLGQVSNPPNAQQPNMTQDIDFRWTYGQNPRDGTIGWINGPSVDGGYVLAWLNGRQLQNPAGGWMSNFDWVIQFWVNPNDVQWQATGGGQPYQTGVTMQVEFHYRNHDYTQQGGPYGDGTDAVDASIKFDIIKLDAMHFKLQGD